MVGRILKKSIAALVLHVLPDEAGCGSWYSDAWGERVHDTKIANAGAKYYFYAWELPIFVAMGCIGGLSGALWIRINIAMTRLRAQHIPTHAVRRRLAEVCAGCYTQNLPQDW